MVMIISWIENFIPIVGIIVVAGAVLKLAIKVFPEYERGVQFRLGRLVGVKGPGLVLIIPIIDRIVRIPLRIVVDNVPPQEVITKDNVTVRVNAVLYYRVTEPDKAVINVERYHEATSQFAQTTMRSVVGQADLDELLSQRDKLNRRIQDVVDSATDPWGIKVTAVEIRDVIIPVEMQRAIGRQAEAERDRRAVIIQAEGEKQAAYKIAEATEILTNVDGAMTLRMLRTIGESSTQQSNTILFPIPMELSYLLTKPIADASKVKTLQKTNKDKPVRNDDQPEQADQSEEHHTSDAYKESWDEEDV
jgi:regulator of protease activity HflC (stomatin/prohibitin superfamily)